MLDDFVDIIDIDKPRSETLLLVAMSGGVDSSTVAASLAYLGYKVIGVTFNLCFSESPCPQDVADAKSVAEQYGFPHYVVDCRKRFKDLVIMQFVDSYDNGKTPVPCIICNHAIKFHTLFRLGKSIDADAVITGHYVKREKSNGVAMIREALDHTRDQSYFLGFATREQIEYLRFPLSNLRKTETREMARRLNIKVSSKIASQDICFMRGVNYRDFVSKYRSKKTGVIVDINNNIIGTHDGIHNFTVGQRKGIKLNMYCGEPLYVIYIDASDNRVTVGKREMLMSRYVEVENPRWMFAPSQHERVSVKLRSSQPRKIAATITSINQDGFSLELDTPYFAVTPGQACIVYKDSMVMGGGIIRK